MSGGGKAHGGGKGHGGGHKKGGHEEEHENHERWLVTYADMLTLLMVLFIVLFSISIVDKKKFNQLRDGLSGGFGAPSAAFSDPGTSISSGDPDVTPLQLNTAVTSEQTKVQDEALQKAVRDADRAKQQNMRADAEKEANNLQAVEEKIKAAAERAGLADNLRYAIDERGLVVTIITSSVVFEGDRAELLLAGRQLLDVIGPEIAPLPNSVEVDGHTNQLPVPTVNYPSAWELSTARASTVVRYLIEHAKLAPSRLRAAGFAGERPLIPPDDPQAPTLNRRVEIVVLSTLPPEERALLASAAGTTNGAHE